MGMGDCRRRVRGVLWVWVIVGEECEVYCEDVWWSAKSARWPVGRGEVKTLVVR